MRALAYGRGVFVWTMRARHRTSGARFCLALRGLARHDDAMTNRIALILGLIIVTLIAYDLIVDDGRVLLFLARKMFVFLDWIAFWR